MQPVDLIVKNLTTHLKSKSEFSDIRFVTGFAAETKASPLIRPVVSISVKKMEEKDVDPVYTKVDEKAGEIPELLYNHTEFIRLRVDVHVPLTCDGVKCYEIFRRISDTILNYGAGMPFVGAGCEEIRYNRERGAFTLYTYLDLYQTSIVK